MDMFAVENSSSFNLSETDILAKEEDPRILATSYLM